MNRDDGVNICAPGAVMSSPPGPPVTPANFPRSGRASLPSVIHGARFACCWPNIPIVASVARFAAPTCAPEADCDAPAPIAALASPAAATHPIGMVYSPLRRALEAGVVIVHTDADGKDDVVVIAVVHHPVLLAIHKPVYVPHLLPEEVGLAVVKRRLRIALQANVELVEVIHMPAGISMRHDPPARGDFIDQHTSDALAFDARHQAEDDPSSRRQFVIRGVPHPVVRISEIRVIFLLLVLRLVLVAQPDVVRLPVRAVLRQAHVVSVPELRLPVDLLE